MSHTHHPQPFQLPRPPARPIAAGGLLAALATALLVAFGLFSGGARAADGPAMSVAAGPALLGRTTAFTATASSILSGTYRLDWSFGGAAASSPTQSLADTGTLTFTRGYTFTAVGAYTVTGTLMDAEDNPATAVLTRSLPVTVSGGTIGVALVGGGSARPGQAAPIRLSMPAAVTGTYRLVLRSGAGNTVVTETVSLTTSTTLVRSVIYASPGRYQLSASLLPAAGATPLAQGQATITASAPALSLTSLPGGLATLGRTTPFTATATGLPTGTYRLDWSFGGGESRTLSQVAPLSFTRGFTFTAVGRHSVGATLSTQAGASFTQLVSSTLPVTVTGGTIEVALASGSAVRPEREARIRLSLPPTVPGAYRLVVSYGDGSAPVTETVTLTTSTTLLRSKTYSRPGAYPVTASLLPAQAATPLAQGRGTIIAGGVYLPMIASTGCNDIEENDSPSLAKGLFGTNQKRLTCVGNFSDDPEGEDDYYLVTTLGPNETLSVTVSNIPAGADYNLGLYRGLTVSAATLLESSTNSGSVEERISFKNDGSASVYLLRIFMFKKATPDTVNRYTLTAEIK